MFKCVVNPKLLSRWRWTQNQKHKSCYIQLSLRLWHTVYTYCRALWSFLVCCAAPAPPEMTWSSRNQMNITTCVLSALYLVPTHSDRFLASLRRIELNLYLMKLRAGTVEREWGSLLSFTKQIIAMSSCKFVQQDPEILWIVQIDNAPWKLKMTCSSLIHNYVFV